MKKHSPARDSWTILSDLELISRGKVRDTYRLPDGNLLVVATDGISIFDFVLNALVPMKGVILNAMNHFWLNYLEGFGFETHFVAAGSDIDKYLPASLRNNFDLQSRAMIVKELDMVPVEFIFRNCLTGSGLSSYKENGEICGHKIVSGLQDGDELPFILDTPTNKAEEGHDEPISAAAVSGTYPTATHNMINIFQIGRAYAKSRGIQLADTKFEGSADVLGDEVLTPDSSRFWDLREWQMGRRFNSRKAPASLDKELVRTWGKSVGINKLDPKNPDDVLNVHSMAVPEEIIAQTTEIYRYIFWRLTGMTIEKYLWEKMDTRVLIAPKDILIVCGSETDLPKIKEVLSYTFLSAKITIHVLSCHRNPFELMKLIENLAGVDVIIGVGSKALALPGIIDAWANYFNKNIRVVGVALGDPDSNALLAAQLSIEEIPGQPVIMDELTSQVYTGDRGLKEILVRIDTGELPPVKPRKEKPVQMNV